MSIEMYDPENILSILHSFEKKNPQYTGITFSARQYFFVDPMIPYENGKPGVGNKLAFEMFIQKMKPGYYVSMDGNDLKRINKISHIAGDLAIKSIGKALRNATLHITDSTDVSNLSPEGADLNLHRFKLFRSGGDEFLLYCEKKENVFIFLENAIQEIDKIEVVNDSKLSLSFGIGITYSDAEDALAEAKNKKTQHSTNLIHSNLF